jgi:YjjG family noncanonical pyrimidine nucleotidase
MYKHVFIDLDDTIWDFHQNARLSLNDVYIEKNLSQYFDNFEQYFQIYAKRNLELWEMYGRKEVTKEFLSLERMRHPLATVGVDNIELAKQIATDYLDKLPTYTALVPYALELLEYLFPKYSITIVSNGFIEVQYRKIKSCKIEKYLSHVVLSEGAGALKPDKRIFEYALALNNALASETIMIGDSYEADIRGAQNAGIDQIYFNRNHSDLPTHEPATYKVKSLAEIVHII